MAALFPPRGPRLVQTPPHRVRAPQLRDLWGRGTFLSGGQAGPWRPRRRDPPPARSKGRAGQWEAPKSKGSFPFSGSWTLQLQRLMTVLGGSEHLPLASARSWAWTSTGVLPHTGSHPTGWSGQASGCRKTLGYGTDPSRHKVAQGRRSELSFVFLLQSQQHRTCPRAVWIPRPRRPFRGPCCGKQFFCVSKVYHCVLLCRWVVAPQPCPTRPVPGGESMLKYVYPGNK